MPCKPVKFFLACLFATLICACHPFHGHCAAVPKIQRIPLGNMQVLAILDAPVTFEKSVVPDVDAHPETSRIFDSGGVPGVDRVFYFTLGKDIQILVDAGWGDSMAVKGETANILAENGIRPENITDILLTHMDFDHIGGLLRNGNAAFPRAKIHVARPEFEAWTHGLVRNRPKQAIELAQEIEKVYRGRIRPYEYGDEIFPGVIAREASGHTPGHTVYDIVSNGQKLTIAGDIAHVQPVQLKYPEISSVYDMDPQKAAKSRKKEFERAAKNGATFGGMHIPPIGKIGNSPDGGYMIIVEEQGK